VEALNVMGNLLSGIIDKFLINAKRLMPKKLIHSINRRIK